MRGQLDPSPDPRDSDPRGHGSQDPETQLRTATHPEVEGDAAWMGLALEEAQRAFDRDEVPIGAILVRDGQVLARGHNLTRWRRDPTAHAEMRALVRATRATGDLRLPGAVVYTTVEPCFMCAGALVHARVERVVWGTRDEKFGGCVSLGQVLATPGANHLVATTEGVRADEARALLREFFQIKRTAARRRRDSEPG